MHTSALLVAQQLIDKHFTIWNSAHPEQQVATFSDVYADTFFVADYADVATGFENVAALISRVQREHPGFSFTPDPVTWNHGLGRVSWGYGPQENPNLIRGEDIFTVRDGRLDSLWVFINTR